jgi:hypothetical protein
LHPCRAASWRRGNGGVVRSGSSGVPATVEHTALAPATSLVGRELRPRPVNRPGSLPARRPAHCADTEIRHRGGRIRKGQTMTLSGSQPTRRQLIQGSLAAGITVAASAALSPALANAAATTAPARIRPFRVEIRREQVVEMRRRVAATRWPSQELVMSHGWPGSIVELLETVDPLPNPIAHGGTAADAFHLVLHLVESTGAGVQRQPDDARGDGRDRVRPQGPGAEPAADARRSGHDGWPDLRVRSARAPPMTATSQLGAERDVEDSESAEDDREVGT